MHVFVRRATGEAAKFQRAAEAHLNGKLVTLSAVSERRSSSLDALAEVLHDVFAHPELPALAHAADVYELDELHENAVAGRLTLTAAHLRPTSRERVWERLCWMLTERNVFYRRDNPPWSPREADELAAPFARWWLGAPSPDSRSPFAEGWHLAAIDPEALDGFHDGFYDTAFVAWRGVELRLLLQNGTD